MAKRERKDKIHVLDVNDGSPRAYLNARENRAAIMLCGVPLWYTKQTDDGRGTVTRRHLTIPMASGRQLRRKDWPGSAVVSKRELTEGCKLCAKLVKLTPAERVAMLKKIADDKVIANAAAKLKNQDKRQVELDALDLRIATAQVEALACLDFLESTEGEILTRCKKWLRTDEVTQLRCNFSLGHEGACRVQLSSEQPHVDLPELLATAIDAHKRSKNKFDRGRKLYVMRTPPRICTSCDFHEMGDNGVHTRCLNCDALLPKIGAATKRDVVCRFCDAILGRQQPTFEDYQRALFYTNGDLYHPRDNREVRPQSPNVVDVNRHTIVCALRFLGGVQPTQQLPEESYVLTLDDPEEPTQESQP